MDKTVLITGITGQDSSYLSELLLDKEYKVYGVIRRSSVNTTERIAHLLDNPKFELVEGDVTDAVCMHRLISGIQPDEVYNLAAMSVAADCICPIMTAQGIQHRTLESLWNQQVKKKKNIRVEKVDDIDVEVIDLPQDTQLKSLGFWNGMGTWFKIRQISRHRWNDKIAICKQKFGSIKVTPNHSLLDVTGNLCQPHENKWLLNVRKINYSFDQQNIDHLELTIPINHTECDDNYVWAKSSTTKLTKNVSGESLTALCRFIGAYIAEGSVSYNKANGGYITSIANNNLEWLKSLEKDLKQFFVGSCCYSQTKKEEHDNTWNLQMSSKSLYLFLKNHCGQGSNNKRLPTWFTKLGIDNLAALFEKMVEGDGCIKEWKNSKSIRYGTTSYELACQLSLLFTMLGLDYTVNHHEYDNEKWSDVYNFRTCLSYAANQGENGKSVEFVDYDGFVYDISVDEVSNFAVGVGNIVVHNSHVGTSFDQPITTCHINALGPLHILEAIRQSSPKSKFYQASTSELWGDTTIAPQDENTPFNPNSPYAVAKLYAHHIVGLYRRAYGIFACAGILNNHESERRGETFVTRKITKYVATLQNWIDTHDGFPQKDVDVPPLALGNIEAKRDWSHAEDMVRGMWLMMQQDVPDDYVLGSGKTHSVRELLEVAFGLIGLDYKDYVIVDPKFYRPVDVNLLHADPTKAREILGWVPTITFGEMIDRMVQSDYKALIECPV